MKIHYCYGCGAKIVDEDSATSGAWRDSEGKIYCAKCAPVFSMSTSVILATAKPSSIGDPSFIPIPDGTKFWFCESCGQRVTDIDIAEHNAFDKQRRGVFCASCAAGVSTHEFVALRSPKPSNEIASKTRIPQTRPKKKEITPSDSTFSEGHQKTRTYSITYFVGVFFFVGSVIAAVALWQTSRLKQPNSQVLKTPTLNDPPVIQSIKNPITTEPATTIPKKVGAVETKFDLGKDVSIEFILVQAGEFQMGSPVTEPGRQPNESQHKVILTKAFLLSKYEITQAQYENVTGEDFLHPRGLNDASLPVLVTYDNATNFCLALTEKIGRSVGLPTEAQWEYACRAGSQSPFCAGDTEKALSESGWWSENSGRRPQKVGLKSPNSWGFYDMHGNEREWVSDWFGNYTGSTVVDPTGSNTETSRKVLRGGNSNNTWAECRSASRAFSMPHFFNGFRVAIALEQEHSSNR
jgi:formylglycine-generating enzyme required for sulfatase activity